MGSTGANKVSKPDVKSLLADAMSRADRADRKAVAEMSVAERFVLALDLSEFASRNAGVARRS